MNDGERMKISVSFCSGLLAAAIPLSAAVYWIVLESAPDAAGFWLRILILACSLGLGCLWRGDPLSRAEINLARVLGIAACLLLIPVLTATQRSHAFAGWLKTLLLFVVCCLVARALRHPATARVFGIALLSGTAILVAFLLYKYVQHFGIALPSYKTVREFKGMEEETLSLNSVAFTATLSYLAGFCLTPSKRLALFTGVPLFLIASLFTGSRAPLTILAVTLFALLLINGLRSRFLVPWLATALLACGVVLSAAAIGTLASNEDLSRATEGRWRLWSVALNKFAERPLFGYGYDSWRDDLVSRLPGESSLTFSLARKSGGGYHNAYISVLAEQGLIGMLAASLIVWLLLRSSWLLAFRPWGAIRANQWPLFASLFLLLRSNFEVPGLFGYGQDPVDYLAYILVAIVLSRFSVEEDYARLGAAERTGAVR